MAKQEATEVKSKYEIGQYVTVYFDPIAEKDFEGDAKLVKFQAEVGIYGSRVANMWRVKFKGESSVYSRIILEPEG